jgi:hypothetical protein
MKKAVEVLEPNAVPRSERPAVEVRFPEGVQPGNALYLLRKTLKTGLQVDVHKRPQGALIVCDKETVGPLLMLLGGLEGYQVMKV